jgi:DNA-binding SARP family transcriptional activator/pimeloyl-ACP methyl ester carboxylesterase
MWYGILGPLEVTRNGHPISIGGPQQQALLGVLLLNANRMVPADRLIDHLWGDEAPSSARRLLHGCIASLRRTLADEHRQPLVRRGPGYLLQAGPDEFDRGRFDELVDAAQATSADRSRSGSERRSSLLGEALRLWRGAVLDGIVIDGHQPETIGLEERRLSVLEQRVEADLSLGRHADVVPELQALVRIHPLREHPRQLLMAALARCGRPGDALATFRDLRQALMDELGVEPSNSVQELHQRILNGDEPLGGQQTVVEIVPQHQQPAPQRRPARDRATPGEQVLRHTAVGGRSVAWSAVGSGPPVIFASWTFSQLELDWRNPAFQRFVGRLAHHHTVIRYDRLGSGLSGTGPVSASLSEEVAVLSAVVDAATEAVGEPEAPVGLFGFSSGGCIAGSYAATRPDRVNRLVLYGSYAHGADLAPGPTRDALLTVVAAHRGLGSHLLASLLLPGRTVQERDAFARFQRAATTPGRAAQSLAAAFGFDLRDQLGQIDASTLIVHRRADRTVPFTLGQDLMSRIPGAAFVALDGVDHLPWTGDAEAVAQLMIDFLGTEAAPRQRLTRLGRSLLDAEDVA